MTASSSSSRARDDPGESPPMEAFGPEMWVRLVSDPGTRGFLLQPDFVKMMQDIQNSLNTLSLYFKDQRVIQAFRVILNINSRGTEKAAEMPCGLPERTSPAAAEVEPEAMKVTGEIKEKGEGNAVAQKEKESGNAYDDHSKTTGPDNEDMIEENHNENQVNEVEQSLIAVLADVIQKFQHQDGAQEQENWNSQVMRFHGFNPPTFNGRDGPAEFEEWMRSIEKIFKRIRCDDSQKIRCASFQLIEDGYHWLEYYERIHAKEEIEALTWENFKAAAMDEFFPQSYRDQKAIEFMDLKQGNMPVDEYARRFDNLYRFCPHLVDTNLKMSCRFLNGLKPHLHGILAAHEDLEYSEMVKRACAVGACFERDELNCEPIVEFKRKRKRRGNKCYRCYQRGHKAWNCPVESRVSGLKK